jgi:2-polyprenyl-3-methyl-5-hydroxy-6-metoxy-1,4-benzoquinol methylase
MFQHAKNLVSRQIRRRRKDKLIAAGGVPVSWYDDAYGAVDEYTKPYSESRYLPVWEAICERIPEGASVLEVGCGSAQFAKMIHDRAIPRTYVGFDFSRAAIELARKNLPGKRLEVDDARTTDLFTSVDYDTVVCTEVLEHIVDDVPVIQRIPKGKRVLATVPNFDYESHVRFFANTDEVRARYGFLFESLDITEHCHAGDPIASHGIFFLMNGVR